MEKEKVINNGNVSCQDCKHCFVDYDAHRSYLECDAEGHGDIDRHYWSKAKTCEDFKNK